MVMTMVDAEVPKMDEVLAAAQSQEGIVLILFLADKIPSLGHSWCPDCVRAEPVIYEEIEKVKKEVKLVRVNVGDKATWRNPSHSLRLDPRFQVKGVPTLIRWQNGSISGRLEDHQAHIPDNIQTLLL